MWHGCGGVRYVARAWLAAESKRYKADKIRRGVFRRSALRFGRSGCRLPFRSTTTSVRLELKVFAGAKTNKQLSA